MVLECYLLVIAPGLFTHMLDVTLSHDPGPHILLGCDLDKTTGPLVTIEGEPNYYDELNHQYIDFNIDDATLTDAFHDTSDLNMKIGILHYFLIHKRDVEKAEGVSIWLT